MSYKDETRPVRFKEILIVDQDETWALVMRDAVAGGGFRVALATGVDEAIRKLREDRPDQLLVSCLIDPVKSEPLLQELDALRPSLPVVLVGLLDGDAGWNAWRQRNFVSVVRQPFKSRDLLQVSLALLGTTWEDLTGAA